MTVGTEKLMEDEDIAEYQVDDLELKPIYQPEDELKAMALFVTNVVTSFPILVNDFMFLFLYLHMLSSTFFCFSDCKFFVRMTFVLVLIW